MPGLARREIELPSIRFARSCRGAIVGGPNEIEISFLPSEFVFGRLTQELDAYREDIVLDTEVAIRIVQHAPFSFPNNKCIVLTEGPIASRGRVTEEDQQYPGVISNFHTVGPHLPDGVRIFQYHRHIRPAVLVEVARDTVLDMPAGRDQVTH